MEFLNDPGWGDIENVRELLRRVLGDPTLFPDEFKGWLPAHLENNPPQLPVSQMLGFAQFTPNTKNVAAEESTSSTSYVDLSTSGPTLTALQDGLYVVNYGAGMKVSATTYAAKMSVAVNSAAVDESTAIPIATTSTTRVGLAMSVQLRLSGGVSGNTITAKYKVAGSGVTASFATRWLQASRVSN